MIAQVNKLFRSIIHNKDAQTFGKQHIIHVPNKRYAIY